MLKVKFCWTYLFSNILTTHLWEIKNISQKKIKYLPDTLRIDKKINNTIFECKYETKNNIYRTTQKKKHNKSNKRSKNKNTNNKR